MSSLRSIAVMSSYSEVGVSLVAEFIALRALHSHYSKVDWNVLGGQPFGSTSKPSYIRWSMDLVSPPPQRSDVGHVMELVNSRTGATLEGMRGTYFPRAIDRWLVVCDANERLSRALDDVRVLVNRLEVDPASILILVNPARRPASDWQPEAVAPSANGAIQVCNMPSMPVLQLADRYERRADFFDSTLCKELDAYPRIKSDFDYAMKSCDAISKSLGLWSDTPRKRNRC